MKKTISIIIALTVFAIVITQSCNSSSSKLDKFIGNWQSTGTKDKDTLTVKRAYDGIVVRIGKNKVDALYDKDRNMLKIYFMADSITVSYIEKTDHIIGPGNKADKEEYERLK
jgi:hypothetical protein